jgi:hypothetical protein
MNRRRKILIFTLTILVLAVLASVVRHFQLRSSLEAYISRLKAEGEPLNLAQVVPSRPPPGRNATPFITNALSQLQALDDSPTNVAIDLTINNSPEAMNRTIPGKEMIGWNKPVIHDPDGNWPTNSWGDLAGQLAQRKIELDAFRRLIGQPSLDFNYDYGNLNHYVRQLMSRLSAIKQANQWLQASEYYDLHLGNATAACTDVRAMLAFVKGETDERFEICQLVRCAITEMSADATWDILQTTNLPDTDLAQLQHDWQSLTFTASMRRAFLFERVSSMELQNQLRHFHANLMAFTQFPPSSFVVKSKINGKWTDWNGSSTNFYMIDESDFEQSQRPLLGRVTEAASELWNFLFSWPAFYSYQDEQRGLREWQIMFTATRMAETNASFLSVQSFVRTNFFQLGFGAAEGNRYAVFSRNAYQLPALRKAIQAEIARNVVVTAIALRRYQLRHHHLPDTLDELVPDFVESVPTDCMDGQPLRYRRNADGRFLLYSVGDNGQDDGGNPAWERTDVTTDQYDWQSLHALDWVWPQPATPEEIQAFLTRKKSSD